MPRGRYPRRFKVSRPRPEEEAKYLRRWNSRDLHYAPAKFPKLNSSDLFSNHHSLGLEIGCGTGDFICALAARHPGMNFIAVEIVLKPLYRAVHQAARLALDNVLFINADIKQLYPLLTPDSLQVVYLHFPVPGKKKKHLIFEPVFLDRMHVALVGSGRISVRTDQRPLFEEMVALARADHRYQVLSEGEGGILGEGALVSPTQTVWESRGIGTLDFELKKK